jgi:hypothetical protein
MRAVLIVPVEERLLIVSRSDRGLIGRLVQIVIHKGMTLRENRDIFLTHPK